MKTLQCMPKNEQANASELPHWPAPVSVRQPVDAFDLVVIRLGTAVFGLWLPGGLWLSSLK